MSMTGYERIARAATRRMMLDQMQQRASLALLPALGTSLALIVADRLFALNLNPYAVALGPAVAALGLACLAAWLRRPTPLQALAHVDGRLHLHDALGTAIALRDVDASRAWPPAMAAMRELTTRRAEQLAGKVTLRRVIPLRRTQRWWPNGLLAAVLAAAVLFLPSFDLLARSPDPRQVALEERQVQQREQAASAVKSIQESLEQTDAAASDPLVQEQLDRLSRLDEELRGAPDVDSALKDAAGGLHELAQTLDERAGEQQRRIAQESRQFERLPQPEQEQARQLAEALKRQDMQQALQALRDMERQLEQLPPAEREKLARDLRSLAQHLEAPEPAEPQAEPDAEAPQEPSPPDAAAEYLREQGLSEPDAQELSALPDRESLRQALQDRGFDPMTADRIAEETLEEQRREAASQAAEQSLRDVAEAMQETADEIESPAAPQDAPPPSPAEPGADETAAPTQPQEQTAEAPADPTERPDDQAADEQEPDDARQVLPPPDESQQSPPDAQQEAQPDRQDQSGQQTQTDPASAQTQEKPTGETQGQDLGTQGEQRQGDQGSQTTAEGQQEQTEVSAPQQDGERTGGETQNSSEQATEELQTQTTETGQTQGEQQQSADPDATQGRDQTQGEETTQQGADPNGRQQQGTQGQQSEQTDPPGEAQDPPQGEEGSQPQSEPGSQPGEQTGEEHGTGGGNPSDTGQNPGAPGTAPGDQPAQPGEAGPGGGQQEADPGAQPQASPGGTDPAAGGEGGSGAGAAPNPDARGIERLKQEIERLERARREADEQREISQEARRRAEEMMNNLSDEEKERLMRWAQQMQQQNKFADRPPAGGPEYETEAVDARRSGGEDDRVVAEWERDPETGEGVTQRSAAAPRTANEIKDAQRAADRAIEEQAFPSSKNNIVRKYFQLWLEQAERAGGAQGSDGEDGSGAATDATTAESTNAEGDE